MGDCKQSSLQADYPLDRYDLRAYMHPYWEGKTVYQEAVMVLKNADGATTDIPLLYEAEEIVSVRSSDLQTAYQAGVDYALADGKLHILEGTAIPAVTRDFYYPAEENKISKRLNEKYGSGYVFFSEGSLMHSLQIAVTYTHQEEFSGPISECKARLLPKTRERLQSGGSLQVCLFGDSICVGGNSSGFVEAPPMAPTWFEMVSQMLEQHYPKTRFSFRNPSLGGQTSQWGAEQAADCVGYGPDLCIVGFGMNDGTKRIAPEDYLQNIETIMAVARQGNPDCEFVLIAPTIPNKEVGRFLGYQTDYLPMLQSLEGPGVAVADMTTFHQYLLTRKRFFDMSGNNVNHPNDFLARAYAQVIWQTVNGY